ncbi:hypothetical protein ZIOFF_055544 [Zingiber officinale]|uniref:K-box domain-containing protein n=1 Tax=Zingiber officinale TaxID=94328 RepID=A0A8J5KKE9_ZINOF|nr:hypothetical protein ZIOFF_055544 [Zingiber officinale]
MIVGLSMYLLAIPIEYDRSGRVCSKHLRQPMMRLYSVASTGVPSKSYVAVSWVPSDALCITIFHLELRRDFLGISVFVTGGEVTAWAFDGVVDGLDALGMGTTAVADGVTCSTPASTSAATITSSVSNASTTINSACHALDQIHDEFCSLPRHPSIQWQWKCEAADMSKKIEHIEAQKRKILGENLGSCSAEELNELEVQLEKSLRSVKEKRVICHNLLICIQHNLLILQRLFLFIEKNVGRANCTAKGESKLQSYPTTQSYPFLTYYYDTIGIITQLQENSLLKENASLLEQVNCKSEPQLTLTAIREDDTDGHARKEHTEVETELMIGRPGSR